MTLFCYYVKLSKKLKPSKALKTVQIPSKDKPIKMNSKCIVAGWGKTEKQNVVNDLLVTDVSTINFTTCQSMWKSVDVKLPENIICAGGVDTKSGACQVGWPQYFSRRHHFPLMYPNVY